MNRRGFLSSLGLAIVGTGVAYSFPDIIVPKNIVGQDGLLLRISDDPEFGFGFSGIQELNRITLKEIYPKMINDYFFLDTPFFARMKETYEKACLGSAEPSCAYVNGEFIYNDIPKFL